MTTDVDAAEALRMARAVVGLYGDPDVTWGISLEATFEAPVDLTEVDARIAALVAEHPHLGVLPTLQRVAPQAWADERERSASAPFGDDGLLVRLLASEDATRFFVTAHHGVCDGLGLIAVMSAVVGRPLTSSARGVGDRTSSQSFLVSSVLRLGEALLAPPARFSGEGDPAAAGRPERLHQVDEPTGTVNGVRVCAALNSIHAAWPRRRTSGGRRFLVVMGASRRVPGETAPDRQTAYFRIALKPQWGLAEVKRALQEAEPEPTFPETSAGGIGPMVTRALKNRLGYTVNVSNLGIVSGEGLASMAMFPAVNGPQAVGVGLVSTSHGSTVSLRTRRTDFSDDEAQRLLRLVMERVSATQ
ncbi:hypothetical protein [Nocardioides daphniae]|uniref:Condensation domain-containing protein n=1 Tax=Nocardioides daphniae TaxID=402297 RepID=A0ABQ1Q8P8_9ACTN|nr:hypothetical protein [Nocardioides daphniae]GGD19128.1 hypothetical protein GCM10007231_17830 [Nocardioides daphniae]